MFRKLLSRLPYQPSLLPDLVYYSHRLRQEESLRRIGFLLTAMLLLLQISMVVFPAKSSNAASTGDIVYGATTKSDVLKAYQSNRDQLGRTDIRAIFNHYGISEDQISSAKAVTISDADGKNYINTSRSTTKFPDTFVPIQGANNGGIYEFPLLYWRKGEFPSGYPALTGISSYGFRFWILLRGCGNIVFEEGSRPAKLEIKKNRLSSESAHSGNNVNYRIYFRNTGFKSAKGVAITDKLANEFEYVGFSSNIDVSLSRSGQTLTWKLKNTGSVLPTTTRWFTIDVTVRVKSLSFEQQKSTCNSAQISASGNLSAVTSTDTTMQCVTIQANVCPGTGLPIPTSGLAGCTLNCPDGSTISYDRQCTKPILSCADLTISNGDAWNKKKARVTILSQPGATVKEVRFYDGGIFVSSVPPTQFSASYTYTLSEGEHQLKAQVIPGTGTLAQDASCSQTTLVAKPPVAEPLLSTDKTVSNITKNIDDANNTSASAGDTLKYQIFVKNSGTASATLKLEGEYGENIADILEYADLTDAGDALYNAETAFLTWDTVTIAPSQTITKTFTVRVKNPLPASPVSTSNPLSFDGIMHNKYGRDVSVKIDKPALKTVEQTVSVLPNTGPGNTLLLTGFISAVCGYFFFRTRLMRQELAIVEKSFSGGL